MNWKPRPPKNGDKPAKTTGADNLGRRRDDAQTGVPSESQRPPTPPRQRGADISSGYGAPSKNNPDWRRRTDRSPDEEGSADKKPRPLRTQRIEAAYKIADAKNSTRRERKKVPSRDAFLAKPTHWGEVAEWYDRLVGDDGNEYQRDVILPGVLRSLELRHAKSTEPTVLDLGCGQGVLGRFLAREGCRVWGVDAASEMIASARHRNKAEGLPLNFLVGDATRLFDEHGRPSVKGLPEAFDAVTIVLAIQNMSPLSAVWQACHRLLKPGGKLVAVLMHPCFRIPQHADWHFDPVARRQSRLVSRYMTSGDIEIKMHPSRQAAGKTSPTTIHFHRPLQAYINTLGNAGLLIDHIEEWVSPKKDEPGPHKAVKDAARKEIPMFLALRARKF